jgi:hypothetical protein
MFRQIFVIIRGSSKTVQGPLIHLYVENITHQKLKTQNFIVDYELVSFDFLMCDILACRSTPLLEPPDDDKYLSKHM